VKINQLINHGLVAAVMVAAVVPAYAANDVVRVGMDVDAQSLDPRTQRNTTDVRVLDLLYDGLVSLDQSLTPQPNLALSWEQPDATTLIFDIRTDAKFHDGTPVTVDDVIYTYETVVDPALASNHASNLNAIDSVTAGDDNTVVFKLKAPFAPLLSYMDLGIVPKHLAEAGHDLSTQPVGSGPFTFGQWDRGSQIVLNANADYYGGVSATAQVVFVPLADNSARAQALEAGSLDIIMAPLNADDTIRLRADDRFQSVSKPGIKITYVNFNTRSPLLSDPALRRALSMLIDNQTIGNDIFGGVETPATSILMPVFEWGYDASITQPAFDIAAASAALDELGWVMGADGIREKDGVKLAFTLATHSEDSARIQSVEYIQNLMMAAGVQANVSISDFPAFIGEVIGGSYDAALLGWDNLVDPDVLMYVTLHTGESRNWGAYSNPETDAQLERARTAQTQQERGEAYKAAARLLVEDMPYYVLTNAGFDAFAAADVTGFDPDVLGNLRSLTKD